MPLPRDIVLVRHGESEGNVANKRSDAGDRSYLTPEFLTRHSSQWRLTDKGREQAQIAGLWIKKNIGENFTKNYVSEYLRAMETAALLELPDPHWRPKFYLRERDLGMYDRLTDEQRAKDFQEELERKKFDGLYWRPGNSESFVDLCLRLDKVLDTLNQEAPDGSAIVVCHAEVMKAFRILLERIPQHKFFEIDNPQDPKDVIYNCQIIHYSRRNPKDKDDLSANFRWMRSVCPWDEEKSHNEWKVVHRPVFSNSDLLEIVSETPRLYSQ